MRVAVVLPSGPIRAGTERKAFEAGCRWLAERGCDLSLPSDPAATGDDPCLAGDDVERAAALSRAARSGADLLWMGRGGYGGARTLAALERGPPSSPPLFGFSDGTSLLGYWAARGWPCWLAPPVVQIPRLEPTSLARLEQALAGEVPPFGELFSVVYGRARGPLVGGNLTVLASLVGTAAMPKLAGSILVLEDVGEAAYRLDRSLHQLLFARAFEGVRGVVLGTFTGVSEREAMGVFATLVRFFSRLGLPCAGELPLGHGDRNAPLPLGRGWVAELEVGMTTALRLAREAA